MQDFDFDSMRAIALDSIAAASDLERWAHRSQEDDYDVDSAVLHLDVIEKAQAIFCSLIGILPVGMDLSSTEPLRHFPIFDQLALASAHEIARPVFGGCATAHEAAFGRLNRAFMHIASSLNANLGIEGLHGLSPEQLRDTLSQLEKKYPIKTALESSDQDYSLIAWIHREWAAVSQLPLAGDCRDVEQPQEPISPKELLANWREIVIALGMRNNDEDKRKVERLNKTYNGPIMKPGQGKQPIVDKVKLLEWWNNLEKLVESQMEQARDARLTVQDTHPYGREGEVVPEISGQVKKRRRDRQP